MSINKTTDYKRIAEHTKFVISSIAAPLKRKYSEDSSDEEPDESFDRELFDFKDNNTPFTTAASRSSKKSRIIEIPGVKNVFKHHDSHLVEPLLNNVSSRGFEDVDLHKIGAVKASIGLNRMQSLSTRNNKDLYIELGSNVETDMRYEKFGFFWKCQWKDARGKKVPYEHVRKYYKQLKYIDPSKAEKFLKLTESGIEVPYQELREYAKNHDKTKKLVKDFREEDSKANIYLSIVDSDTVDFNGIYSAYLRIVSKYAPTVMTTGYEFPYDENWGHALQFASKVDRMVRVITNEHIPGASYFPEPNLCVQIPEGHDTVPESFVSKDSRSRAKGNMESPNLLRQVKDRDGASLIFSDDKPLISLAPTRAKYTKSSKKSDKTLIAFSEAFKQGASPDESDIKLFQQVTQSHFNKKAWYDNLLVNGVIKIEGNNRHICISLFAQIRNAKSAAERKIAEEKLTEYIAPDMVDRISKTAKAVDEFIKKYKIKITRTEHESKFLKILEDEYGIEITKFSHAVILMLSQENLLEMIEDDKIDLYQVLDAIEKGATDNVLAGIFYDERILDMINDEEEVLSLKDLLELCLYDDNVTDTFDKIFAFQESADFKELFSLWLEFATLAKKYKHDVDEILYMVDKTLATEMEIGEILSSYKEHPANIYFMLAQIYDQWGAGNIIEQTVAIYCQDELALRNGILEYGADIDEVMQEIDSADKKEQFAKIVSRLILEGIYDNLSHDRNRVLDEAVEKIPFSALKRFKEVLYDPNEYEEEDEGEDNEEIIEALKKIGLENFIAIYEACPDDEDPFDAVLEILNVVKDNDFYFEDMLELYKKCNTKNYDFGSTIRSFCESLENGEDLDSIWDSFDNICAQDDVETNTAPVLGEV